LVAFFAILEILLQIKGRGHGLSGPMVNTPLATGCCCDISPSYWSLRYQGRLWQRVPPVKGRVGSLSLTST